jgi:hypothetical protein
MILNKFNQTAEIRSKRGVILSCSVIHNNGEDTPLNRELNSLAVILEGKKYGFVDDTATSGIKSKSRRGDALCYLRHGMDS